MSNFCNIQIHDTYTYTIHENTLMLSALTVALSFDHQFCRQIDAHIKLHFTEKQRSFHIDYHHIQ